MAGSSSLTQTLPSSSPPAGAAACRWSSNFVSSLLDMYCEIVLTTTTSQLNEGNHDHAAFFITPAGTGSWQGPALSPERVGAFTRILAILDTECGGVLRVRCDLLSVVSTILDLRSGSRLWTGATRRSELHHRRRRLRIPRCLRCGRESGLSEHAAR